MTTRLNIVLIVVLGAQLVLAAVLFATSGSAPVAANRSALLPMAPDDVTSVTLRDGEGNTVTLKHKDGRWRVLSRRGFPSDQQRLDTLLQSLHQTHPGLPVATSKPARARFDVAEDDFARHLTFQDDNGNQVKLYLGKAAGAGRVYARRAGENAIRDVALSLWKASAKPDDWLDPGYLQPNLANMDRIRLPKVTLEKRSDRWRVADLPAGRVADNGAIQAQLDRFRTLSWQKLLPKETKSDDPAFQVDLEGDGESLSYRFYQYNKDGKSQWRVNLSGGDYLLNIKTAAAKAIRDASVKSLSRPAAPETPPAENKSPDQ